MPGTAVVIVFGNSGGPLGHTIGGTGWQYLVPFQPDEISTLEQRPFSTFLEHT